MQKLLTLSVMALLVMPLAAAAGIGAGIGGEIGVEEFPPIVWQCGGRVLTDEDMQPWRCTQEDDWLYERAGNYLFEGERYAVDVVVFDKNKIQDITVDLVLEQYGEDFTINCVPWDVTSGQRLCTHHEVCFKKCNARILEEEITEFDPATMAGYRCTITALDSEHMYGDMWLNVQACDSEEQGGECGVYDEASPLFLNPIIELDVDGDLEFEDVRPGTASYTQVVLESEAEGGVLLDMFVTGKNWPAADTELGRCYEPSTDTLVNYLPLEAFNYYAENGAFSTRSELHFGNIDDQTYDPGVTRAVDLEGYVNIQRQLNAGFEEAMFNEAEIIQADGPVACNRGFRANTLTPGGVMALTFRLMLPEPCYGEFESAEEGSIFVWAEAI